MERRAHFTAQPSGSKNQVRCSCPHVGWRQRHSRVAQASKEARRRLEELLEVEHEETQLLLTSQLYG
jgi:hypothetical protein